MLVSQIALAFEELLQAVVFVFCLAFSQMLGKRFPKEINLFMLVLSRSFTRLLYIFGKKCYSRKDSLSLISHKKDDHFHDQLHTAEQGIYNLTGESLAWKVDC